MSEEQAPRRVLVLGASGSIGTQTIDVLSEIGDAYGLSLCGLSVHRSWERCVDAKVPLLVADPAARSAYEAHSPERVRVATVEELIERTEPDVVLNAIVGFAGLAATLAALERGIDVALANKESLVAAGPLCTATAKQYGARILPVDSEHSALLQCSLGSRPEEIESLVLTASGGPFFGRDRAQLADVTVEQALAHPTWTMGGKITIDSATLFNKGLELIEACVLFGVSADEVEIAVHRHSVVHSLVRHVDGSMLAHLGWPDMRVPIAYALAHPQRPRLAARRLDLFDMPAVEFAPVDAETFPAPDLARRAAADSTEACCVLNAANEVAVARFLSGEIGFLEIAEHVARVMDLGDWQRGECASLDGARELDSRTRRA